MPWRSIPAEWPCKALVNLSAVLHISIVFKNVSTYYLRISCINVNRMEKRWPRDNIFRAVVLGAHKGFTAIFTGVRAA